MFPGAQGHPGTQLVVTTVWDWERERRERETKNSFYFSWSLKPTSTFSEKGEINGNSQVGEAWVQWRAKNRYKAGSRYLQNTGPLWNSRHCSCHYFRSPPKKSKFFLLYSVWQEGMSIVVSREVCTGSTVIRGRRLVKVELLYYSQWRENVEL